MRTSAAFAVKANNGTRIAINVFMDAELREWIKGLSFDEICERAELLDWWAEELRQHLAEAEASCRLN
jgi:hypothetical protein